MKQLIIMVAMIGLGVFLFRLIAGPDDSIAGNLGQLWQDEIRIRSEGP
ncbi:MAG TPA: hypothetical protein GX726_05415 [Clostridiales bacterium]|nr:hypothetical protein [Clostridiales bacterium]